MKLGLGRWWTEQLSLGEKKYETEMPRELETIGYSISDVKKKKYFLREWKSK